VGNPLQDKRAVLLDIQEAAGLYKIDVIHIADELDEGFIEEFEKDAVPIYEREFS